MKRNIRKHIISIITIGILIFVSIPITHLVRTKLSENKTNSVIPLGYTNDQSHLNLTKVDTIIKVSNDSIQLINQLKKLLRVASENNTKISIAGTQHSMGGHTITENGIIVNMLTFNKMELDTVNNILTIGSGATWADAIKYLDSYGRSIKIMQAFSTFSIGGSISVNGHGWQKNLPPVSESVISFNLLLANGEIKKCSRSNNKELFNLVIGGYGLFGIILDVKLYVVKNSTLRYKYINVKTENYLDYYDKFITQNAQAKLVFGRLRISDKKFLKEATLNFFEKTSLTPRKIDFNNMSSVEPKRIIFRSSVESEYGKRLRWDLEKTANSISKNNIYTRNELLNDDVSLIENKDTSSTDILHEYFIPERNFVKFINTIKPILQSSKIDLLNITIRRVERDNDSFMNYAKESVYGFVILFNQKKTEQDENEMIKLTNHLVDCTITYEGTYYLPYRLHISKKKMRKVYPQADEFFKLKLKYDSLEIFNNQFYQHYK